MRFAINSSGDKVEVSFSGQKAKCIDCGASLIGKKGQFKTEHWAHESKRNCDVWYEPITEWHLAWQNEFPISNQEITLRDNTTNTLHRADIRCNNGLVIEVQNSSIKPEEIEEREAFYGKEGMIWVLNGESLAMNSKISYEHHPVNFGLSLNIPGHSNEVGEYDLQDFRDCIFEGETYLKYFIKLKDYDCINGNYLDFYFYDEQDFDLIERKLFSEIKEISARRYGRESWGYLSKDITIRHYSNPTEYYSSVSLEKKYWRQFIDRMKYSVFIDNLNGLEGHLLYWYQENRIIKKEDFISKYLTYC